MKVDFQREYWENYPSTETPINASSLNRLEEGVAGLYSDFEDAIEELDEHIESAVPSVVTDWLDDHVNPTGSAVVVDDSLSVQGAAADAKVTGGLKSASLTVVTGSARTHDLDDYVDSGYYYFSGDRVNLGQNFPISGSRAVVVEVKAFSRGNIDIIIQKCYSFALYGEWFWRFRDSDGKWAMWVKPHKENMRCIQSTPTADSNPRYINDGADIGITDKWFKLDSYIYFGTTNTITLNFEHGLRSNDNHFMVVLRANITNNYNLFYKELDPGQTSLTLSGKDFSTKIAVMVYFCELTPNGGYVSTSSVYESDHKEYVNVSIERWHDKIDTITPTNFNNYLNGDSKIYPPWEFVYGAINLNTGVVQYERLRGITKDIQYSDRLITFKISSGFRSRFFFYDSEGTYINKSGWKTETYYLPAGKYFRLQIALIADDQTYWNPLLSVEEYIKAVTVSNWKTNLLSSKAVSTPYEYKQIELEQGGFDNNGINSNFSTRIRSTYYIPVIPGARYSVFPCQPYDDKSWVRWSASFYTVDDYVTSRTGSTGSMDFYNGFTVPDDVYFVRLLILHANNEAIIPDDVPACSMRIIDPYHMPSPLASMYDLMKKGEEIDFNDYYIPGYYSFNANCTYVNGPDMPSSSRVYILKVHALIHDSSTPVLQEFSAASGGTPWKWKRYRTGGGDWGEWCRCYSYPLKTILFTYPFPSKYEFYNSKSRLSAQDIAVYGGHLFEFTPGLMYVDSSGTSIRITNGHGNNCNFGITLHGDFPYLYCGAWNMDTPEIYVNEITLTNATLVRTITFTGETGHLNMAVDESSDRIYVLINKSESTYVGDIKYIVAELSTGEVLSSKDLDFTIPIIQGMTFHNGLIYVTGGGVSPMNSYMMTLDIEGNMISKSDPIVGFGEIEGIDFYNSTMYLANSSTIYW